MPQTALVTGATEGIGRAIAIALGAAGHRVGVCARDAAKLKGLLADLERAGVQAAGLPCDVGNAAEVERLVAHVTATLGPVDILVNNAGIGILKPFAELSLDEWDATMATNVRGLFLMTRAVLPGMRARKQGAVVNISSIFGTSGGFGTSPAYHAAKGAVRTLTKNAALHWATEGIRVNSVHPGFIATPILEQTKGTDYWNTMVELTPMGHLGQPEDIAAAVAYLASDDAKFVTGLELYVDGGYIAR